MKHKMSLHNKIGMTIAVLNILAGIFGIIMMFMDYFFLLWPMNIICGIFIYYVIKDKYFYGKSY